MIKFENHVPDTYVVHSRDFQLFVAVFDYFQNATKFRIDSIRHLTDTATIQDSLLPYLQTKLGFFTSTRIPSSWLRTILKSFQSIVRHKGSREGILMAINTFLNAQHELAKASVNIDNTTHTVYISTTTMLHDREILEAMLEYVVPAGYKIEYSLLYPSNIQWYAGAHDTIEHDQWTSSISDETSDESRTFTSAVTVLKHNESDKQQLKRTVNTTFIEFEDDEEGAQ